MEQRNFLILEYHKRKDNYRFMDVLLADFQTTFPGSRVPAKSSVHRLYRKLKDKGTINNLNSAASPGQTHSGRPRTSRTPPKCQEVKNVMDRDSTKELGDPNVSPVSSARRNPLIWCSKSSWSRIKVDLKYHPYKVIRQQELRPEDYRRRLVFCQHVVTLTDLQILKWLFSDEAKFHLCMAVNTQNVRRYCLKKTADPVNGGRPAHFTVDHPTFSPKLMVFCGLKQDGTFGLKFYRNESMDGAKYKALLQYHCLPELRRGNGGNLDGLWWQQDGAPCHVTNANIAYLERQFGVRLVSRRTQIGLDWPARSPDLNPLDFFLWGYLKSLVYNPRPATLDELERNITQAIAGLDPAMINRAILDIRARCHACIAAQGGHFEN